jgi:protein SCO1
MAFPPSRSYDSPAMPKRSLSLQRRGLVNLAALAALAGLIMAGFLAWQDTSSEAPVLNAGVAFPEPRLIPEFHLLDQHARPFTRAALEGRWTVVFAGFASCPDICPTTLVTLASLDSLVHGAGGDLQVVFLSLDPERDTPEALASYLEHYSPRFVGATGTVTEIDKLMAALGLAYLKVPLDGDRYTIDHSAALILVDPRGRAAAYFKPPLRADRMAADLIPMAKRRQ